MPVYKHTPGETILISCRELHNIITANCTFNDGRAQRKNVWVMISISVFIPGRLSSRSRIHTLSFFRFLTPSSPCSRLILPYIIIWLRKSNCSHSLWIWLWYHDIMMMEIFRNLHSDVYLLWIRLILLAGRLHNVNDVLIILKMKRVKLKSVISEQRYFYISLVTSRSQKGSSYLRRDSEALGQRTVFFLRS